PTRRRARLRNGRRIGARDRIYEPPLRGWWSCGLPAHSQPTSGTAPPLLRMHARLIVLAPDLAELAHASGADGTAAVGHQRREDRVSRFCRAGVARLERALRSVDLHGPCAGDLDNAHGARA